MPRGIALPKYRIYECRTTAGKDALIALGIVGLYITVDVHG